jgi:hypothetical protein
MRTLKRVVLIISLMIAGMLPSLSEAGVRVYVRYGPPAPRVFVQPRAPYAGAIWVAGRWTWNGRAYVWMNGRYLSPRRGFVFVPGHWQRDRRGWYWVDGQWRRA